MGYSSILVFVFQLLHLILITFPYFSSQARPLLQHKRSGLTIPLIHRDSPSSPFYNPTISLSDYWRSVYTSSLLNHNFVQASFNASLATNKEPPSSFGGGEYLMQLSIGTPPMPFTAMFDLSGDFIWVQCNAPFFDPNKSSTYKSYSCSSSECRNVEDQTCLGNDRCGYIKGLPDGTTATGFLSYDTFTIPTTTGNAVFNEVGIGCGTQNTSFMGQLPVRVGIAGSSLSLTSQIGDEIKRKFSHCLVRRRSTNEDGNSRLLLGEDAVMIGNETALNACSLNRFREYFSPTLEDISVGEERLGIPPGTFEGMHGQAGCGVILESSTLPTYLAKPAFDKLVSKIKAVTRLSPVAPKDDFWTLCYNGTRADLENQLKFPSITLNFKGLDLPLQPLNLFAEVDSNTVCLLMAETDGISIIGSYALQDKNVGYDLLKGVFTIASVSDCANV